MAVCRKNEPLALRARWETRAALKASQLSRALARWLGVHTERPFVSLVQKHKGIIFAANHEPGRGNITERREPGRVGQRRASEDPHKKVGHSSLGLACDEHGPLWLPKHAERPHRRRDRFRQPREHRAADGGADGCRCARRECAVFPGFDAWALGAARRRVHRERARAPRIAVALARRLGGDASRCCSASCRPAVSRAHTRRDGDRDRDGRHRGREADFAGGQRDVDAARADDRDRSARRHAG